MLERIICAIINRLSVNEEMANLQSCLLSWWSIAIIKIDTLITIYLDQYYVCYIRKYVMKTELSSNEVI